MRYRRCLVAADGWYEWKVTPAGKILTLIQRIGAGGEIVPFYFAGLWASWRPKDQADADWLETFTILTRAACPELQEIHDRMPVVLPHDAYDAWLDRGATDGAAAATLLESAVLEGFAHYPVSARDLSGSLRGRRRHRMWLIPASAPTNNYCKTQFSTTSAGTRAKA